jgi:hypothetical protein
MVGKYYWTMGPGKTSGTQHQSKGGQHSLDQGFRAAGIQLDLEASTGAGVAPLSIEFAIAPGINDRATSREVTRKKALDRRASALSIATGVRRLSPTGSC